MKDKMKKIAQIYKNKFNGEGNKINFASHNYFTMSKPIKLDKDVYYLLIADFEKHTLDIYKKIGTLKEE